MTKSFPFNILALGAIIIASGAITITSSLQEAAIMDELAHIPAGYGYVKYFDYRLNPEHPPMVKILAALPLAFMDLKFPTDKNSWQTDINGQWLAGAQFLYEEGNDADQIINWSRLGPIFLFMLLLVFVYIWAKELMGKYWALVPTLFTAFSPSFLAHGHYVTTDIGATIGIFISLYYFVKFLLNKSFKTLIWAGIAFGLAQLMKFSLVLAIPLFLFLAVAYAAFKTYSTDGRPFLMELIRFVKESVRYLAYTLVVFIVGTIVIYAVYAILVIGYPIEKQLSDTTFILSSFGSGPAPSGQICDMSHNKARCLADINIEMIKNPLTRPLSQYMLGVLMVMQRSSGGNTGYFLGEVSAAGWWYYFPVVLILKEPIPSLLLILVAFLVALSRFFRNFKTNPNVFNRFFNWMGLNFAEFSMLSFVILYWAYSIKSPLNIGIRHVMPTLPFMYILSVGAIKRWVRARFDFQGNIWKKIASFLTGIIKTSAKLGLLMVLILWLFVETLIGFPYYISYFNEFAGGPMNGYKYVTDSNYDWGQDLLRLQSFVIENKIPRIGIDYFGGGNPRYYMPTQAEGWWSSRGNPLDEGINWIAISANTLMGSTANTAPGFIRKPEDEYRWLTAIKDINKPDYRIGTSIFVFKLK